MEIDIQKTLLGDLSIAFFIETTLRTVFMFFVMVFILRLTGKRGLRQLSFFEIAIVITLGPSAGDAMFYNDFGLAHVTVGFILIIYCYRFTLYFIRRNETAELILVGGPTHVIHDGVMTRKSLKSPHLGRDELFGELRNLGVEHLGQIKTAILEDDGELSLFYHDNCDVKPGLPILPDEYSRKTDHIRRPGIYACSVCGTTEEFREVTAKRCDRCQNAQWVRSLDRVRIL